jgi:PD-(D/E)XK nuclease superfamily
MRQWSISAHNTVRRCQRQFFFKYLMAWHNAKDAVRSEAYYLNQLRGLQEWRGHVVHLALEQFFVPSLKKRKMICCEELTEATLRLAERQFLFSQRGDYKRGDTDKKALDYLALREHEYGIAIQGNQLERIYQQIRCCYEFLYSQAKFLNFLQHADWHEAEPPLDFYFDRQKIAAKLDLVVRYKGSKLCVVDWKIAESQTSDYSAQLQLYAMAALSKWPAFKVEDLLLVEANLLQGEIRKHAIDGDGLLEIEDLIFRSLSDIRALTSDRPYSEQDITDSISPTALAPATFATLKDYV